MDRTIQRLDRKGITSVISKTAGTSGASFAPGCNFMLIFYSDIETPPVYTFNKADGKQLSVVMDNKDYASRTTPLLGKKEFFKCQYD